MTSIILERTFDPPRTVEGTYAAIRESAWCYEMHRVDWRSSFLSTDGRHMICWFEAPDVESARKGARRSGADISVMWNASVHEGPRPADANVVVTRSFAQPVSFEQIQAIEDAAAWCLETHRVTFVRTFFSRDRQRMICLYQAPDAEAVRAVQREAQLPFDAIWAFLRLGPDTLAAATI